MITPEEIAFHLLQIKAIKLSPQKPFTWASGMQSPIYCDNRVTLSYPELRTQLITELEYRAHAQGVFQTIAGVATAGVPWGAMLAEKMNMPFIYIRPEPKAHGMNNQIEGKLEEGMRVLIIEDLLSTGGSSLKAVHAIRNANCSVTQVLALFSYGLTICSDSFKQAECPVRSLSSYKSLISTARNMKIFSDEDLEFLETWNSDPKAWSDQFKTIHSHEK